MSSTSVQGYMLPASFVINFWEREKAIRENEFLNQLYSFNPSPIKGGGINF
jgi:hypothetical protein